MREVYEEMPSRPEPSFPRFLVRRPSLVLLIGILLASALGRAEAETPKEGCALSLLWGGRVAAESGASLTQFPLRPPAEGAIVDLAAAPWFGWRGSGETPILMHDPSYSGRATTSKDLIGNHAFGKEWPSPYAALASLDADKDGRLRGAELHPLALWFDRDRDGRSDSHEVKSVENFDFIALFFKPDESSANSAGSRRTEARATFGYQLVEGGRLVTRPTFTWCSPGYGNRLEAIRDLEAKGFQVTH